MLSGKVDYAESLQGELNRLLTHERSAIMITKRIFTMHFWQEFLPEQDIWWSQIRSMAMDRSDVMVNDPDEMAE